MMETPHGYRLRKGRCSETNRIYLITTVTQGRVRWFDDLYLGRAVVRCLMKESRYTATLAYVVMSDHLHWLMQLGGGAALDVAVGRVKSVSTRLINQATGRKGRLWQAGFHDHAVRREEDVRGLARYVVRNPVRGGTVQRVGDYSLWDAIWV